MGPIGGEDLFPIPLTRDRMTWFTSTSAQTTSLAATAPSGGPPRPSHTCRSRTLTLVSLLLLAVLVLSRRHDLATATGVLTRTAPAPFLVAVALSVVGVVNRAGQYRAAHRVAGASTTLRPMLRISAASYALNKVVKTGGVGGVALFVRHGRRRGHPAGSVVAACIINSLGNQLGMLVLTTGALAALMLRGSAPGAWTLAAAGAVLVLLAGLAVTATVGLRSEAAARRWYPVPFVLLSRVAARLGMSGPPSPDPEHLDRFFEMVGTLRRDPRSSLPVLAHAVAAKLIGATVLAIALLAVGAGVSPGSVLVVYVLALAAAATTILPGGLGAVEATMTLTLTGYGVPTSTALAGTIVFRLLDLWVPVVIGLIAAPGLDRSAAGQPAAPSSRSVNPAGA